MAWCAPRAVRPSPSQAMTVAGSSFMGTLKASATCLPFTPLVWVCVGAGEAVPILSDMFSIMTLRLSSPLCTWSSGAMVCLGAGWLGSGEASMVCCGGGWWGLVVVVYGGSNSPAAHAAYVGLPAHGLSAGRKLKESVSPPPRQNILSVEGF